MSPEDRMLDVVAPLWSMQRTCAALGINEAGAMERQQAGTLLGLQSSDGVYFYPLSQFEKHGDVVRVRPALVEFFTRLRNDSPWAVAMVTATPAEELDGLSPVEWARQGEDVETLLMFASVLRSEWR